MNNRYGSIMERITAQQEVEDREDGDAIRREYARDEETKRVEGLISDMIMTDPDTYSGYLEEFLLKKELMGELADWLFDKVQDDNPVES